MQPPDQLYTLKRYYLTEVVFFLVYLFVFPVIVDIEFSYNELHNASLFTIALPGRLFWGLLSLPPYLIYYRYLSHKLLLHKKYGLYLAALILFIAGLNLYTVYLKYWLVSHVTILPADILHEALVGYRAKVLLHFSVIYVFRDLLVITALSFFIKTLKQEQQVNILRQQQTKAELKSLKMQLNPHFFFNTLNSIYALALERSDQTAPLIAQHAEMMRYIIYNSAEPKVSLQQEIKFLSDYINVETIRYQNTMKVSLDTQLTGEAHQIEPLLLLPFIENAFKHGAQEETGSGYIEILICVIGQELVLEVRNSKPASYRSVAGIGLINARQRLNLLYEGMYTLHINEQEKDHEVKLTIKLR